MAWRHADTASTSAVGLIIAAATFAIAFTAANLMVERPARADTASVQLDSRATVALDLIVSQPGRTTSGLWSAAAGATLPNPDTIQRFGLAKEGEPSFLDYRKIKSMRNASMLTSTNQAPDYTDVRAALDIREGDFHLRTYPVIPDIDDPRWTKESRGRYAYIAHYEGPRGQLTLTAWANTTPADRLNVSLAIRNDASTPQIYVASVGAGNNASGAVIRSEERHTRLLAPGEVQTVRVVFPKMAYSTTITGVKIDVTDGYGNTLVQPYWLTATAPSGTNAEWAPLITAGSVYFRTGETLNFSADHYKGDGGRVTSGGQQTCPHAQNPLCARIVLVGPSGAEISNQTISLPKNGPYNLTCAPSVCSAAGTYTAVLWSHDYSRRAADVVHVSSTELFAERGQISALALKEIDILKSLTSAFNGVVYDADTAPHGDVFPDASHLRELPDLLPRYSSLIVGSEVKQNALNSAQIKWGIANWVQNGGNLIVLGTHTVQSRWLEPVYHAAQVNANGGIGTPDPTHPVLSSPNKLDYQRYLDRGRAWDINNGAPFTHVLSRGAGAGGNSMRDTLAIANPGAYNDGSVVLSSYMPGSLTEPQDDMEAKRFLHNLMSQSYNMLFLDFGPPIPDKTAVGSAQRLVAVPHP
ncbi:MAG TPA: hypothetical protein VM582_08340, partial [Candidatus Thermoplasmatota archaeon]|nr:hypothetical protein [Candidatus Thermoplasmatota archaeon]